MKKIDNFVLQGCYTAAFTESAKDCDGFENKDFICVLNIEIADNEDGESGMVLTGRVEVNKEITDEVEVSHSEETQNFMILGQP